MVYMFDVAKDLIAKGYNIFQVEKDGKAPFSKTAPNGCISATSNPNVVSKWFEQYPSTNIGIKCDNILVIDLDVDPDSGGDGTIDIITIERQLGKLPKFPRIETPSGGYHLYFKRPSNVDIIGQTKIRFNGRKTNIDIRVGNQYVVAPGSTINGMEYRGELPAVEDLPELSKSWIDNFLPRRDKPKPKPEPSTTYQNRPLPPLTETEVVIRCRNYLSKLEPAIAGQNGHAQFLWACRVIFYGYCLPEETGRVLLEEYNQRCLPPFEPGSAEYEHKISEAQKDNFAYPKGWLLKSQDPKINRNCPEWVRESVEQEQELDSVTTDSDVEDLFSIPTDDLALMDIKYPEFIIEPFFREAETVLIYAQRGVGKSWFALSLAKAISKGEWAFGSPIWTAPKQRKVLYLDGEMAAADVQQRIISLDAKSTNFRIINPELSKLDKGIDLFEDVWQVKILKHAKKLEISVIVIDNLATLYHCDKPNESQSWQKYDQFILSCRKNGIACIIIDHCGKDNERGANGSFAKTNIVNHCIRLDKLPPANGEGTRFILQFQKSRSCFGSAIAPIVLAVKDGQLTTVLSNKKQEESETETESKSESEPEQNEQKENKNRKKTDVDKGVEMFEKGYSWSDVSKKFSTGTANRARKKFNEKQAN